MLSDNRTRATCRHCGRLILKDVGRWIDPEATGDDRIWRETCDAHDTFTAEHEPDELDELDDFDAFLEDSRAMHDYHLAVARALTTVAECIADVLAEDWVGAGETIDVLVAVRDYVNGRLA